MIIVDFTFFHSDFGKEIIFFEFLIVRTGKIMGDLRILLDTFCVLLKKISKLIIDVFVDE